MLSGGSLQFSAHVFASLIFEVLLGSLAEGRARWFLFGFEEFDLVPCLVFVCVPAPTVRAGANQCKKQPKEH